jgi:hypothetical protein
MDATITYKFLKTPKSCYDIFIKKFGNCFSIISFCSHGLCPFANIFSSNQNVLFLTMSTRSFNRSHKINSPFFKRCRYYKNAASASESETRYLAIRAWWLSSGATTEQGLSQLELWLAFWHFCYRQWSGFM